MHCLAKLTKFTATCPTTFYAATAFRLSRPITRVQQHKVFSDKKDRLEYEATHHAHLHKKLVFLSALTEEPDCYTVVQEADRPPSQTSSTLPEDGGRADDGNF